MGKEPVLLKQVIGEQRRLLELWLHRLLLAVAAQKEEKLRLESISRAITVEIGEKGILVKGLQDGLCPKLGLKQSCECGLPHTDDALDRDICVFVWLTQPLSLHVTCTMPSIAGLRGTG
jgi:hypothetical protein